MIRPLHIQSQFTQIPRITNPNSGTLNQFYSEITESILIPHSSLCSAQCVFFPFTQGNPSQQSCWFEVILLPLGKAALSRSLVQICHMMDLGLSFISGWDKTCFMNRLTSNSSRIPRPILFFMDVLFCLSLVCCADKIRKPP